MHRTILGELMSCTSDGKRLVAHAVASQLRTQAAALLERWEARQSILMRRRQPDYRAHLEISTERVGKLYLPWSPALRFEHPW